MINSLPVTCDEIRAVAAHMFKDSAVHSVNVLASWGEVTVFPNGEIRMAQP
jgi:hypothetical protein